MNLIHTSLLMLCAFFLLPPSSFATSGWKFQCKADKKVECEAGKCVVEPTVSVEFDLTATKASVGLYSMMFEGRPVVRVTKAEGAKEIENISFLATGKGTSGDSKQVVSNTVVGHISWEKKTFRLIQGETIYTGSCKQPGA